MFWHMAGLSTASPVETILDKDNFTLEELLDDNEIIQECKALNGPLISLFLFVSCEIFTCEVDIILKALVEDDELMDRLFSFLDPEHPHSTPLAGYFSKVVVCLLLRKTTPLMNYIWAHQDIIKKLVDLVGITSVMEVLIRLIGTDEHIYANCVNSMQWLEDMDVPEMIVDVFSSSDCPEVHANAAETLCTIARWGPVGLASKISSSSFIGRLFRHALEDSRPTSVLVNLLLVCISLLDPKRLTSGVFYVYNHQMSHGAITANPQTVQAMLENLGDLLKLLDVSSEDHTWLTTYGKLKPPLGKHRLKIIEFISVLVAVSSEVAEKELIRLGAVKCILELFFEYPYNNFLHHHVEHIVISCLGSKNHQLVGHLLYECNLVGKILEAEKIFTLAVEVNKPTVPTEGRSPPRIGNIGHLTRIANKLIQLANSSSEIQKFLQENSDWVDWQTNVLLKRNTVENILQWASGRPTTLQDRTRDSDDDDYQDREYDVATLANNLSQAFRYIIYTNDTIDEGRDSLEQDDEDVLFDDESAEVAISSLRLGDNQEGGSLFTNSDWFAFEDERISNEYSTVFTPSSSHNIEGPADVNISADDVIINEDEDLADTAISKDSEAEPNLEGNVPETIGSDKLHEWVEWRESSDSADTSDSSESEAKPNEIGPPDNDDSSVERPTEESIEPAQYTEPGEGNERIGQVEEGGSSECEVKD